ncbi:hypothetical protein HDU93_006674 [Gonapodya sp. JEL0774]|nr:hypothetical protein HDU93_006674 [Gonapodya sp. JEL0774]
MRSSDPRYVDVRGPPPDLAASATPSSSALAPSTPSHGSTLRSRPSFSGMSASAGIKAARQATAAAVSSAARSTPPRTASSTVSVDPRTGDVVRPQRKPASLNGSVTGMSFTGAPGTGSMLSVQSLPYGMSGTVNLPGVSQTHVASFASNPGSSKTTIVAGPPQQSVTNVASGSTSRIGTTPTTTSVMKDPPKRIVSSYGNFTIDELLDEGCKYLSPTQLNAQDALLRFRTAIERAKIDSDRFRAARATSNQAVALRVSQAGKGTPSTRENVLDMLRDAWKRCKVMLKRVKTSNRNSWTDVAIEFIDEVERRIDLENGGPSRDPSGQAPSAWGKAHRVGNWGFRMVEGKTGLKAFDPAGGPPMIALLLDLTNNFGNTCFSVGNFWEAIAWWEAQLDLTERMLRQFPLPSIPGATSLRKENSFKLGSSLSTRGMFGGAPSDKTFKLLFIHRVTMRARVRAWTHLGFGLSTLGKHREAILCHYRGLEALEAWQPLAELHERGLNGASSGAHGRESRTMGRAGYDSMMGPSRPSTASNFLVAGVDQATPNADANLSTIASLRGICCSHLATAYEGLGMYRDVLRARRTAIEMFKACGDRLAETREKGNLGGALVQWSKTVGDFVLSPEKRVPISIGEDVRGVRQPLPGPILVSTIESGNVPGFPRLQENEIAASDDDGEPIVNLQSSISRKPQFPIARLSLKSAMSGVSYLMDQWYVGSRIGDWLGIAAAATNLGNAFSVLGNPAPSLMFYLCLYVPSYRGPLQIQPSPPTTSTLGKNDDSVVSRKNTQQLDLTVITEGKPFLWRDVAGMNIAIATSYLIEMPTTENSAALHPENSSTNSWGGLKSVLHKAGENLRPRNPVSVEARAMLDSIGVPSDSVARVLESRMFHNPANVMNGPQRNESSNHVYSAIREKSLINDEVVKFLKKSMSESDTSLRRKDVAELAERLRNRSRDNQTETGIVPAGSDGLIPITLFEESLKRDIRLEEDVLARKLQLTRLLLTSTMSLLDFSNSNDTPLLEVETTFEEFLTEFVPIMEDFLASSRPGESPVPSTSLIGRLAVVAKKLVETLGNNALTVEEGLFSPAMLISEVKVQNLESLMPFSPVLVAAVFVTAGALRTLQLSSSLVSPDSAPSVSPSRTTIFDDGSLLYRAARLVALRFALGSCRRCLEVLSRNRNLMKSDADARPRMDSRPSVFGGGGTKTGTPSEQTQSSAATAGPKGKPKSRRSYMPLNWKIVEYQMSSCPHVETLTSEAKLRFA